jgi:hypothetical protein
VLEKDYLGYKPWVSSCLLLANSFFTVSDKALS